MDLEPEHRGYKSQYYREITPDYVFGGVKSGYIEMVIVTTKLGAFEKGSWVNATENSS